jgi:hypothetical protein
LFFIVESPLHAPPPWFALAVGEAAVGDELGDVLVAAGAARVGD